MSIYTPVYTFSNGTTADGGQVEIEKNALGASVNSIANAQIASDAAIAISKTALGTYTPWTTYTPVVAGGSSAGVGTYNVQVGTYCQMGKLIYFMFTITLTNHTGTGDITVTLPVANIGTANHFFVCSAYPYNCVMPANTVGVIGTIGPSGTVMYFTAYKDNAVSSNLQIDTDCSLFASGFYEVA